MRLRFAFVGVGRAGLLPLMPHPLRFSPRPRPARPAYRLAFALATLANVAALGDCLLRSILCVLCRSFMSDGLRSLFAPAHSFR